MAEDRTLAVEADDRGDVDRIGLRQRRRTDAFVASTTRINGTANRLAGPQRRIIT